MLSLALGWFVGMQQWRNLGALERQKHPLAPALAHRALEITPRIIKKRLTLLPPSSREGYSSANKLKPNLTIYMTHATGQESCQNLAEETVDAMAMLMRHSPAGASSTH